MLKTTKHWWDKDSDKEMCDVHGSKDLKVRHHFSPNWSIYFIQSQQSPSKVFFVEIGKPVLKFTWNSKEPRLVKVLSKKKTKLVGSQYLTSELNVKLKNKVILFIYYNYLYYYLYLWWKDGDIHMSME